MCVKWAEAPRPASCSPDQPGFAVANPVALASGGQFYTYDPDNKLATIADSNGRTLQALLPMWGKPRPQAVGSRATIPRVFNEISRLRMQKMTIRPWLYVAGSVGSCALALLLLSLSRALDSDAEADQRSRTISVLSICGAGLDNWSRENKRAPSAREGLSVVEMKVRIPLDGWGRPIIFKSGLNGGATFQLYSVGKNGIDEKGNGDDMSYRSRIRVKRLYQQ